jgi:hypothetical protein
MTAVQRSHRMTVEEAWLARRSAASTVGGGLTSPPELSDPASTDPGDDSECHSVPPHPVIDGSARGAALETAEGSHMIDASAPSTSSHAAARSGPPIMVPMPRPEVRPPARPRIEPEPAILGLSRHTRSRLGSRLFNLFFVLVFVLILAQMVVALLTP